MASCKKLPSGSWRAQAYCVDPLTGKVHRPSFTAATKSEAQRMANEYQAKYAHAPEPADMTVGECLDRYIAAKRESLSPSTLKGYLWMRDNRFQNIENIHIGKLTDEIVQRWISDLSLNVSSKSIKNAHGLLVPALAMFTDRTYNVKMPARKAIEYHIPTDDDIKLLLKNANPQMRLSIALAASGTMRLGEIPALKFKDVLRDQSAVYVHADIVAGPDGWVYKEIPKNDSSVRIIPLPPEIMDMIGEGDPEDFVYPVKPSTIEKNFWQMKKKLGLKCRFHDLRHYAASIMHALGIPDQFIQERGGWKTDATLKAVYRHALSDQSKKYAQVANNHFASFL